MTSNPSNTTSLWCREVSGGPQFPLLCRKEPASRTVLLLILVIFPGLLQIPEFMASEGPITTRKRGNLAPCPRSIKPYLIAETRLRFFSSIKPYLIVFTRLRFFLKKPYYFYSSLLFLHLCYRNSLDGLVNLFKQLLHSQDYVFFF